MTESEAKLQCNDCKNLTWHVRRSDFTAGGTVDTEEDDYEHWSDRFEVFQCRGCGELQLRRTFVFTLNGPHEEVTYYPPRVSRAKPHWLWKVPETVYHLASEVYSALQADCRRLAVMGLRAMLDVVIVDKVGDAGSFKAKLTKLQESGVVAKVQAEFLEAVLNVGSAAAHRGHAPSGEDLESAMDIVENLLQASYVLKDKAALLRKNTPPRKRRDA